MLRRDADVGCEQQRHAAAKAIAVDRRDHGLPDFEPPVEELGFLGQHQLGELGRLRDKALDVGAGRERLLARAGDHCHPDRGVIAHRLPRLRQAGVMFSVERVEALGPVDRNQRNAVRDRKVDRHCPECTMIKT